MTVHRIVRPRWVASAAVVATLVAAALGLRRLTTQLWDEMGAWADAAQARWEARDFERRALWGETRPGSAWEAYGRAVALAPGDDTELLAQAVAGDAAGGLDVLRARWREPVRWLRIGAHRSDVRPYVDWQGGVEHETTSLLGARALLLAVRIEARCAFDRGHPREAVELLLDGAAYGLDLTRRPFLVDEMIGISLIATATGEALPEPVLAALPAAALERLGSGLAALDAALTPTLASAEAETVMLARMLRGPRESRAELALPLVHGWRYAFSVRLMHASCILELAEAHDDLRARADLPWPQRAAAIEGWCDRLRRSDNPLTAMVACNSLSAERGKRETIAAVRRLRMRVDGLLGRAPEPLSDPLGAGVLAPSGR